MNTKWKFQFSNWLEFVWRNKSVIFCVAFELEIVWSWVITKLFLIKGKSNIRICIWVFKISFSFCPDNLDQFHLLHLFYTWFLTEMYQTFFRMKYIMKAFYTLNIRTALFLLKIEASYLEPERIPQGVKTNIFWDILK